MNEGLSSRLKERFEAIRGFRWKPDGEPPESSDLNDQWQCYSIGLKDQHYRRELSEAEEEYERVRWLRARLMLEHLDDFSRLIDAAYDFVATLADSGGQPVLGERAGLPVTNRSAQPSDWVQFGPIWPLDRPPLDVRVYEKQMGGPHVFAARLLWWCAAAKTPRDFGFPDGFRIRLLTQPIWATNRGWLAKVQNYPILQIKNVASAVVSLSLASEPSTSGHNTVETRGDSIIDGPCSPDKFLWRGKTATLTGGEWDFLDYLWKRPSRTATFEDAIDEVWLGADVTPSAITTCASRIGRKLAKKEISVRVRVKKSRVYVDTGEN